MIAQIGDFRAGLAGAMRFCCGLILLRTWFLWHWISGKQLDYASAWKVVMCLRWLFEGRAYYSNTYRDDWRHFVLVKLLRQLNIQGCKDVPQIKTKSGEILANLLAKTQTGIVLVAPHSRVMSAVDVYATKRNLQLCGIADYSGDMKKLIGLNTFNYSVKPGANSLLEARYKLQKGISIYECADFWRRRKPTLYHDLFVSTGLFELAAIDSTPMLYVKSQMDDDGVIWLQIDKPSAGVKPNDSVALAYDFIAFCERVAPQLDGMSIAVPQKRSQLVNELKALCILSKKQRRSMT